MSDPNNPRDDLGGARTGFDNRMSYTDYLALDELSPGLAQLVLARSS